jgi:hypothetical protein
LLKVVFIFLMIVLLISFFLLIGIRKRRDAIQTYSVPFFIQSYYNVADKEHSQSLIEKLNKYFEDTHEDDLEGDDDMDGE